MVRPDSFFSRIARDLIWTFHAITFALFFVLGSVSCEVSEILGGLQMGLCAVAFLLSLITGRIGCLIVSALMLIAVPAVMH